MQQLSATLTLIATLLCAAPVLARVPVPAPTDAELMHQALWSCKGLSRRRRKKIDLGLFRALLDLEQRAGVPAELRGMTLAKACIESGYNPVAKGDCGYGSCKALGIIQLWPWTLKFGVNRTDPIDSVAFLLERVKIGITKVGSKCPRVRGDINRFVLAWLRINRGPLRRGKQRCVGTPHGLRRLRQWHRNIKKVRRQRAHDERAAQRRAQMNARRELAQTGGALHRSASGTGTPTTQSTSWGYNASSAIWSTRPVRRIYMW